jgi:hypothetical protein
MTQQDTSDYGTVGEPAFGEANPPPAAAPLPATPPVAAAPAAPPPTTGPGSATQLRTEQAAVQKQLDELQAKIAKRAQDDPKDEGPLPSENTLIASLNTRLATLAQNITTAEAKTPQVVGGGSPTDKFIVRQNPDGTLDTQPNPNWDGKSDKPQTISAGNRIFNVAPDGKVTVAYTDQDAQGLAQRQTATAEQNARTAAAAQAAQAYAENARVDLETRVSNGEDAASVRAEQALKLQELHQNWVEADGDARRAAEDLRDYNTNRHQDAADQLGQDQLEQTRQWQAMQDATSRRGQDIGQQTAQAQIRSSLANQRLSSGTQYMGNTMDMLSRLNAAVQPGSGAVADMLIPLMNLGQSFFSRLGGLDTPESIIGGTNGQATGPTTTPPGTLPTEQQAAAAPLPTVGAPAPLPAATPTGASPDDWFAQWQARQAQDAAEQQAAQGIDAGVPAFASGGVVTRPTLAMVGERGPEAIVPLSQGAGNTQMMLARMAQANAQAQLAAQAAAAMGHPPTAAANPMLPGSAHPGVPPQAAAQQAMARPLHPDGTPFATAQDVMALWAQRRGVQPAMAGR